MPKGPGIGYNHGADLPPRCTKGWYQLAEMGSGVTGKADLRMCEKVVKCNKKGPKLRFG